MGDAPDDSEEKDEELDNTWIRKKTQRSDFVQGVIDKGQPWTDPDFPPETKSLYDPEIDVLIDTAKRADFDAYEWKRASEIFDNVMLFSDKIQPNDINQGQLGDCYFLAVLSSLAEFPDRIRRLIKT